MVNWRSRGDWDTYSANLRNALNIAPRDLDLGMTKTARKFSSSQDIMETLIHITDSYNWSEVGFGSSLWVSIALAWAPCHWDVVVICAVLLLRNRPLIKFVSFAREESSWIYWADVYSHRPLVCWCTVPEDEDDDEGMNSLCRQIEAYRQESRHLDTHYEGLFLWHILPYRIDTTTWSCYHMMDLNFANLFSNCTLYVHGVVEMPIQPTWEVWVAVYWFFLQHPFCFVWCDCINSVQTVFFWQVSARMSRFSGWLCCLIQVDLPCIFFHRSTLLSSWDPHREDCNGSGTLVALSRQHSDLFVGTVASPYLTNHVAHLLPCTERLCGTIAWGFIAWNHDVHSWTSVISD